MRIKNILLTAIGLVLIGIGAIGLFFPVLPTTPFVIMGTAFLSATPKLKSKIEKIPYFREHIENYRSKKGLPVKTVVVSLSFLWIALLFSMYKMSSTVMNVLLSVIGIAVTIHILWVSRDRSHKLEKVKA